MKVLGRVPHNMMRQRECIHCDMSLSSRQTSSSPLVQQPARVAAHDVRDHLSYVQGLSSKSKEVTIPAVRSTTPSPATSRSRFS